MKIKQLVLTGSALIILALASLGCQESKAKTDSEQAAEPAPKASEACNIVLTVSGMS